MSITFKFPQFSFTIETPTPHTKLGQMGCKINTSNPHFFFNFITKKASFTTISFSSSPPQNHIQKTQEDPNPKSKDSYKIVNFKTLGSCKLGISKYPDFVYNAQGGIGTGTCSNHNDDVDDVLCVDFDVKSVYIPPLTSETAKFLGLPLPPFLKINILPQLFHGTIAPQSGQIDFNFEAKFLFSIGTIYRAPPLVVKTVLTSEESNGVYRRGKGERLNREGQCRLVGVATVDPIDDLFMNTFLSLPTECLAVLNATIQFSSSPIAE